MTNRAADHPPIVARMLSCLRLGWSVFPLSPREKLPHGKLLPQTFDPTSGKDKATWGHYKAALPSSRDVQRWGNEDPSMNYAIVTGRVSGLLVADADGPMAVAWMEEGGTPQTPTGATSPGKRHFLFAYPHDGGRPFTNRAGLLTFEDGSQLDIRAEAGYIVGAGSIHPNGGRYEWLISPDEVPPAPVPPRLLELLRPVEKVEAPSVTANAARRNDLSERAAKRRAAYVEKAIADELASLRNAPEGQRNKTLFQVVRRCFQFVASNDTRESDIERDIRSAAAGYIAADGERAFQKTFDSGRRRGLAELPQFPDFEDADESEPEQEREKVLIASGDGATALLEQYHELEDKLWGIVTADPKQTGWDPAAKLLGVYTQLALFRTGGAELVFDRGAAGLAPAVGLSAPTVGTHAERLTKAGLAEWKKGKSVLCDRKRRPVDRCEVDPARTVEEQGLHWEAGGAALVLKPLPSAAALPILARTERQEKQAKREEAKRGEAEQNRREVLELRETVEKLEAAHCPHCHEPGTLEAHCTGCGAIVTAADLAEMTGTEPEEAAPEAEPIKTFNSSKHGEKVLIASGDGATAEPPMGGGRWAPAAELVLPPSDHGINYGAHMARDAAHVPPMPPTPPDDYLLEQWRVSR